MRRRNISSIRATLAASVLLIALVGCRSFVHPLNKHPELTLLHPWSIPEFKPLTVEGTPLVHLSGVFTYEGLRWAAELHSRASRGISNVVCLVNLVGSVPDGPCYRVAYMQGSNATEEVTFVVSSPPLYADEYFKFVDASGESISMALPWREPPWNPLSPYDQRMSLIDWRWLVGNRSGCLTIQKETFYESAGKRWFPAWFGGIVSQCLVTNGVRSTDLRCMDMDGRVWAIDFN